MQLCYANQLVYKWRSQFHVSCFIQSRQAKVGSSLTALSTTNVVMITDPLESSNCHIILFCCHFSSTLEKYSMMNMCVICINLYWVLTPHELDAIQFDSNWETDKFSCECQICYTNPVASFPNYRCYLSALCLTRGGEWLPKLIFFLHFCSKTKGSTKNKSQVPILTWLPPLIRDTFRFTGNMQTKRFTSSLGFHFALGNLPIFFTYLFAFSQQLL